MKTYCLNSYTSAYNSGASSNDSFYDSYTSSENTPLLMSLVENSNYKVYTKEKVQYLENSRKVDNAVSTAAN